MARVCASTGSVMKVFHFILYAKNNQSDATYCLLHPKKETHSELVIQLFIS
jgi:hypothetical protein